MADRKEIMKKNMQNLQAKIKAMKKKKNFKEMFESNEAIHVINNMEEVRKYLQIYITLKGLEIDPSEWNYVAAKYFGKVLFSKFAEEVMEKASYSYEWLIEAQKCERTYEKCAADGLYVLSVYHDIFYRSRKLNPDHMVNWAKVFYKEYGMKELKKVWDKGEHIIFFYNVLSITIERYVNLARDVVKREVLA